MRSSAACALIVAATLAGCAGSAPAPILTIPPATPGLELGAESYPEARRRFATKLVRPGPASDRHDPLPVPPGAVASPYESAGRTLHAVASPVESGSARRPAVLFLHGGFTFGSGHWEMTRPFRDAGYVVMVPTLRGENGQAGACSFFYDEVDDVLAAADSLRARRDVDPGRVFLAGHSVGGTLVLLTSLTSDRFAAAASFSGAPDQIEWTRGRADRIPFAPDRPDEFRLRSAVAFANGFRCPIRLFYGEDEYWLHSGTLRTTGLAQQAGLNVGAIELPGGHDSVTPDSVATCLRFFASIR